MLTTKKIEAAIATIKADTKNLADSGAMGCFSDIEVNLASAEEAMAHGSRHNAAGACTLAARALYGTNSPKHLAVCSALAFRNCGFAKFGN